MCNRERTRWHLKQASSHLVSGMHVRAVVMARMRGLAYQLRPLPCGQRDTGAACEHALSFGSFNELLAGFWSLLQVLIVLWSELFSPLHVLNLSGRVF